MLFFHLKNVLHSCQINFILLQNIGIFIAFTNSTFESSYSARQVIEYKVCVTVFCKDYLVLLFHQLMCQQSEVVGVLLYCKMLLPLSITVEVSKEKVILLLTKQQNICLEFFKQLSCFAYCQFVWKIFYQKGWFAFRV